MEPTPELDHDAGDNDPFDFPHVLFDPDAKIKKAKEGYDKHGHNKKLVTYVKPVVVDELQKIKEDPTNILDSVAEIVRVALDDYISGEAFRRADADSIAHAAQLRAIQKLNAAQHRRWLADNVSKTYLREMRHNRDNGNPREMKRLYREFLEHHIEPTDAMIGFAEQYGLDGLGPASSSSAS